MPNTPSYTFYDFSKDFYDNVGQESPIHLTVNTEADIPDAEISSAIEYCIRTKWTGAAISWNGSEKIL